MRIQVSLLALIALTATAAAAQPTVMIAGLFDLSGGGAIWGKSERNAFELAVTDFRSRHPGVQVRAVLEDSQYSSKQTASALQKLISIDKARYVVGTTWETTAVMMPICESRKVVCISPSYHGREYYSRPWRYNFTAWFEDKGYMSALVSQMNARGYRRVAVFSAISSYYDQLVESYLDLAREKPLVIERVVLEDRDFRSTITKTPEKLDAIVMLLDNAGQIQAFLKQWSELRKDRPDIYTDDLIVYLDPPEDVGRYGFTFYYSAPVFDAEQLSEFSRRYSKAFGASPEGASAAVAYDETMIVLECALADPAVEAVRECVANTKGYHGYSGTFSFDGRQTVTDRQIVAKKLG